MPRTEQPCLEHRPDAEGAPVRTPLDRLPFRIGRSRNAELVFSSPRVSKLHAEIWSRGSVYLVRDLDSRNGTFVNGERVERERRLEVGDVLHVAHRELRFVLAEPNDAPTDERTLAGADTDAEEAMYRSTRDLYRIISGRTVSAVFQPILELAGGHVVGYEALGRHTLPAATYDATTLFKIASERGRAHELSTLMRAVALADSSSLPREAERVFMNVHPDEMRSPSLMDELERARVTISDRVLVVEIHEAAITELGQMRALRDGLRQRGIELAYDDFGAGQSRLMELAEVPPDFLKLDMSLIRAIDESPARQELVAAFVKVLRDAGVRVVAEGIETSGEHETCLELGCELGQGFLFRHPVPVDDLRETWP